MHITPAFYYQHATKLNVDRSSMITLFSIMAVGYDNKFLPELTGCLQQPNTLCRCVMIKLCTSCTSTMEKFCSSNRRQLWNPLQNCRRNLCCVMTKLNATHYRPFRPPCWSSGPISGNGPQFNNPNFNVF